jgi:hypothetical protein
MSTSEEWADVLPVKNLGPGVAVNARARLGNLGAPSGVFIESVPTSLGPGDREDLRLNWQAKRELVWDGAMRVLQNC